MIIQYIFSDHTDEILDVSFSLSGKYIITASADKTAILYNATTFDIITIFKEHENEITKVFLLFYFLNYPIYHKVYTFFLILKNQNYNLIISGYV